MMLTLGRAGADLCFSFDDGVLLLLECPSEIDFSLLDSRCSFLGCGAMPSLDNVSTLPTPSEDCLGRVGLNGAGLEDALREENPDDLSCREARIARCNPKSSPIYNSECISQVQYR
jgi:hypothetical protein